MSLEEEQITFFAQTDSRGAQVPFGIKAKDRTKHVYVIGKTGMGKSTLLENMAVQDIKNGNGLAFIDPHGQTAEKLLDYVPESRKDDVLYFAPFDTNYPVAFNVMEDVEPDRRHLVVSGLMSVFKKIWVDAWSARMEYILSNTLLALLEYPQSTLLGVNRMLSDKHYRKKVIDNITDPSVKSFWVDEFLKYNERYMQEAGDAIKNKIGQFTSNPLIRNIVGQPKSSFDIREIMDKKKILIMNLSKGLVGETNANLLGSMLTTRIYLAAMSRADMSQETLRTAPQFYFYVDEFQSFANATFANILSEARKYKLNLTIAHQYIEQMEEEVRNAVFGNVGTTIVFRVGPFDAEVLETVFSPKFLAPDIVNLGFAQIYLTLMIDGIGSAPFSATTLLPIKPSSISCKEMILHRSREQFAFKRAEVEKAIYAWHGQDASVGEKPIVTVQPKKEPEIKIIPEVQKVVAVTPTALATPKPVEKKAIQTEAQPSQKRESIRVPYTDFKKRDVSAIRKDFTENKRTTNDNAQGSKSLDELRAVLKNLSISSNTKKDEKIISEQQVKQPPEGKKNTLKMVDSAVQEGMKVGKQEQGEIKEKHTSPKQVSVEAFSKSPKEEKITFTPRLVATAEETFVHYDDPLSPKKLERMMRITGNDKMPFG